MMNKKKINKLKLTVSSKRENKQIGSFFASNSNEKDETEDIPNQSSIETKAKRILKETETVLDLTEDDDCENSNKLEKSLENEISKNKNDSENFGHVRKTVISKFFDQSLDDFEVPEIKRNEKKTLAEKLINTKSRPNKRKKQTTIKSAFAKNEEIFSELMAQHSIAENFNPDEMQMALACSMSEAEINTLDGESSESVTGSTMNSDEVREKLLQYGFKANSNNEDYDVKFFLPRGRNKAKWANKFTSLTLRCPEKQERKLDERIAKFLSSQFVETELFDESPLQFNLSSPYLKSLIPEIDTIKYFRKCLYMDKDNQNIEIFYVTELFKPSKSKPGSLLKDFKKIPGRDQSPKRQINTNKNYTQIKENIDQNLNEVDEPLQFLESRYNLSNESLIIKEHTQELKHDLNKMNTLQSSNKSPKFSKDKSEFLKRKSLEFSTECKRPKIDLELTEEEIYSINRPESPDIFVLSDEDSNSNHEISNLSRSLKIDPVNVLRNSSEFLKENHFDLSVNHNELRHCPSADISIDSEKIEIYEKFSSDEVKVSEETNFINTLKHLKPDTPIDKFVDLTQSEESLSEIEFKAEGRNKFGIPCIILSDDEGDYSTNKITPNVNHIDKKNLNIKYNITQRYLHTDTEIDKNEINRISTSNLQMTKKENQCDNEIFNTSSVFENNMLVTPIKELYNSSKKLELEPQNFSSQNEHLEKIHNTQESSSLSQSDDSCIILSDDEVNYSIINSAKKNFSRKMKTNDEIFKETDDPEILVFTAEQCESNNSKQGELSFVNFINVDEVSLANLKYNFTTNDSHLQLLEDNLSDVSDLETQLTPKKSLNFPKNNSPDDKLFKSPSPVKPNKTPASNKRFINKSDINYDSFMISDIEDETVDLNNLRRKYGLASIKKNSNAPKSTTCRKSLSESFLKNETEKSTFQRFSSSKKINTFAKENLSESDELENCNFFTDFDEFDKLVYGSPIKSPIANEKPRDFEKLLTAKVNEFSPEKPSKVIEPFEFESNGKIYLIKTQNVPIKPDYNRMDSPTRLKELYELGIKPLKKKQAITMLEYIYNQTHPIILEKINSSTEISENKNVEENLDFCDNFSIKRDDIESNKNEKSEQTTKLNQLNLKDYFWEQLDNHEKKICFEDEEEMYIFQTNISKKVITALLPFHIAWSNLVKSNLQLRESILHFEPIDLQEIYVFLKSIGYRYDPKDIRKFFDNRSIVFRYDLGNNSNRHLRKKKK